MFVTACHSGFPADTKGLGLMEHEYPEDSGVRGGKPVCSAQIY